MTEAQELTVTETTQATPAPAFHQEQVKKPRTPAQMAALEAARQKAFAIRAEKKKEKISPVDQRVAAPEPVAEEPHEEVEYVKKGKAKPKAKKRSVLRCKHLRLWHEASPLPRQAGGAPPASRSRRTKAHGTSERAPARENLSREQACQTQSRSQSQQESAASRRRSKRSSHEKARPPEREVTRVQEAAQVHSTRHPNLGEK